jgi:hypothetical protein
MIAMKKAKAASTSSTKKDIIVKTGLTFEELMKKALNTPLPKKAKKAKKK